MPQTLKETMVSDLPQGAGTAVPAGVRPSLAARVEEGGRQQPVCLETPVTVSGVRTLEGSDKREPFTETTSTVLVFGRGAVLRLPFSLTPGQLLFLTNTRTKKETVCQVVKSKTYKNVNGYVEVEFSEPAVGFWGMRFPGDPIGAAGANAASPAGTRERLQEAEAQPAASQPAGELPRGLDLKPPVAATPAPVSLPQPASESLTPATPAKAQTENVSAAPPSPHADSLPAVAVAKTVAPAIPPQEADSRSSAAAENKIDSVWQPVVRPVAAAQSASPRSFSAKLEEEGLPIPSWFDPSRNAGQTAARYQPAVAVAEKIEKEVAEELPDGTTVAEEASPELETHLTPPWLKEETVSRAPEVKKGHGKVYGAIAAVLVLAAAGGGVWYYRQFAGASRASVAVNTAPRIVAAAPPAAAPAQPTAASTEPAASAVPVASGSPVSSAKTTAAIQPVAPAVVATAQPAVAILRESAPRSSAVIAKPAPPARKALPNMQLSKPKAASKASLDANSEADANLVAGLAGAPVSGDGASSAFATSQPAAPKSGELRPARVLSTVPAVYPALAKSQNISGDVQLDALIGADGRVSKMRVISGPPLLQQAAKDALGRWKYVPASLDGKPTEMHVTVTLRFRLQQ